MTRSNEMENAGPTANIIVVGERRQSLARQLQITIKAGSLLVSASHPLQPAGPVRRAAGGNTLGHHRQWASSARRLYASNVHRLVLARFFNCKARAFFVSDMMVSAKVAYPELMYLPTTTTGS